jgi:hypothetical protein
MYLEQWQRWHYLSPSTVSISLSNFGSCQQYASASWTRPSGEQGINALFLPTTHGLIGAVFPLTGLPELPKPSSFPGLPAEVLARMQQMPPEQMELVLMQWRKHREGSMPNQGTSSGAGGGADSNNNPNSFGSSVSMSHNQLQQQSDLGDGNTTFSANLSKNYGHGLNIMNTMGLSATLSRPVSGNGVGAGISPGNVSYDMLKSFIQRGGGGVGVGGQGGQ